MRLNLPVKERHISMRIINKIAITIVMSIPAVGNVLAKNKTSMANSANQIPQNIIGHWYAPCNPDSNGPDGKQSSTIIYRTDGTWSTFETIFLDSKCTTTHQIANFFGTYEVSADRISMRIYDWTMTPMTQERADFLNARANCGITAWRVGETPQVTTSPDCDPTKVPAMDSKFSVSSKDGNVYLENIISLPDGSTETQSSVKLSSGK